MAVKMCEHCNKRPTERLFFSKANLDHNGLNTIMAWDTKERQADYVVDIFCSYRCLLLADEAEAESRRM